MIGEEEILRLDVPMDQVLPMHLGHGVAGLHDEVDGAPRLEPHLALEDLLEVLAIEVFHDEVRHAVVCIAVVHHRDHVLCFNGAVAPPSGKTGREVLHWAFHEDPLDLVILDPNLSDERDLKVFEKILDRIPELPVIVHGFGADFHLPAGTDSEVSFVEKRGGSIEELKRTVFKMLHPPSAAS